ncbi:MAG: tetratricopeptide repeat protein [Pseudonocardiales bacterium]|nr:tetratricopeptide repeat protein [Pseudonocardiales bacterium]
MGEGARRGLDAVGVDFFVSHAGRDRAWAEWVAWHLVEAGYTVELGCWDWAVGENFLARMYRALDAASRVVALFSPAYFEELRYTTEEWTSALVKGEGGHRLVPVRVEPCAVPRLLRPLVCVDLVEVGEAEAVRRLVAAARGPARPDGKPVFPGRGRAGVLTEGGQAGPRLPGVLPAVWNVGPRNPGFVGRDAMLVQLRERLRSGGTAVVQALHGRGGVGKTQVAIEYAYRYAGAYEVVWWVSAEQTSLIGEQYAALSTELDVAPPRADTVSAVGALRAYLRGHDRWLLVLDNAESPQELREWLPAGPGHILITSRNPSWGELATRIEIDVLPRPDSRELIHVCRPGVEEADANRLAEALGDLPLALAQAAGFLAETGMPVDHYLRLLTTHAEELLDQSPPQSHPHSLAAAIRISTDRLAKIDPAALALVRIGAFLAPDPIPADILTHPITTVDCDQPPELKALTATVTSPVAAHRSLGRVGSYGLARTLDRGLQLHRLTQAILRDHLPTEHTAAYRSYAQVLLVAADPGNERDPGNWPRWAQILPHLLATDPASSPSPHLRDLACRAAMYLWHRGERHPFCDLAEHLYRQWREHLGPDDRHTLEAAGTLVRALSDLGSGRQARQLGEDTLTRCRRMLGNDHPVTLKVAHHFGSCLHEVGAFEQSRQLNADTLARRRRMLGDEHDLVQQVAHNLGINLRELGEVETARQLHEDILAYRRRTLGEDHPLTINTATELGLDLHALGQINEARQMHQDCLTRAQRVLGEDHTWTLGFATDLARDLNALGEHETARQLSEDTLARAQRVLGEKSYYTIEIANELATALLALGQLEAAQQLSEDTLTRARRISGDNHPRAHKAARNLATARQLLGKAEPSPQDDSRSPRGPRRV